MSALYYAYDGDSNLTKLQYPRDGQAAYFGYDQALRLEKQRTASGGSAYYEYDASGNVVKKTLGNGMESWAAFDKAERMAALKYNSAGGAGVVAETWRTASDGTQIYAFTYQYDDAGNRLAYRKESTVGAEYESAYYSYAADNSMTKRRKFTPPSTFVDTYFTYDANGSLIKEWTPSPAATTYYEYGPHGFITRITPPTGSAWNFFYDARLNRYRIDRGGTDSYFLWDGLNLLEERDGAGNLVARYTHGYTRFYGIGSIVEIYKPGTPNKTYTLAMDHRGTAYVLMDESATEVGRREYDAFGNVLSQTGTWPVDVGYQSGWLELSISGRRLLFSPSRIYDPETGVFLQRDPLAASTKIVQASDGNALGIFEHTIFAEEILSTALVNLPAFALYSYLNGNVTSAVDPTGFGWWDWVITGEYNPSPEVRAAAEASIANEGYAGQAVAGVAKVTTEVAATVYDGGKILVKTGAQNYAAVATLGAYGQFGRLDVEDNDFASSFYGQVGEAKKQGKYGVGFQAAGEIFWRGNPLTGIPQAIFDLFNSCNVYEGAQNITNLVLVSLPLTRVNGLRTPTRLITENGVRINQPIRPSGIGMFGIRWSGGRLSTAQQLGRLFYYNAKSNVARGFWRRRLGIAGDTSHIIPDRWPLIPRGIKGAGLNFLDDPASFNRGFRGEKYRAPVVPASLLQGAESAGIKTDCPPSPQNCDALRKWLAQNGYIHPFL